MEVEVEVEVAQNHLSPVVAVVPGVLILLEVVGLPVRLVLVRVA